MPLPRHAQGHSRHANPYNSWVARERQEKYYERKKTLARFKRMEKYESKQQQQQQHERSDGKHSFLERAIHGGQEAFDAEYERRLALSFGDVPAPVATLKTEKAKHKKKRKQQRTTASATAGEDATHSIVDSASHTAKGDEYAADIFQPRASAKRMRKGSAATAVAPPVDRAVGSSGEHATKVEESKAEEVTTTNKSSKKQWQRTTAAVPYRFAKELRKHQEAEDAKQAEWLQRQEEIAERKRKRRSFQRERAVKGGLLAQRTARGQPNMKSMLQVLTAKLKPELRNS